MLDFVARAALSAVKFGLNANRASHRKKVKFYRDRLVLSYDEPLPPLGAFTEGALPDALDAFSYRVATAEMTGDSRTGTTTFEGYVARALADAGAPQLREICARVPIDLVYDEDMARFFIRGWNSPSLAAEDSAVLEAVAAALNRALLILIPLDGLYERRYGNERSIEDYSELDWNTLCCVTRDALACATAPAKKNPSKDVYDVVGEPGGDWDALTRFFNMLMKCSMPFGPQCVADLDTESGLAVVEIVSPSAAIFPQVRWRHAGNADDADAADAEGQGAWVDAAAVHPVALAHIQLALSALLAADAFASSERISRAIVNVREDSLGDNAILSVEYDREGFLGASCDGLEEQLALDAERGFCPEPDALLARLAPARVLTGDDVVPLSDSEPTFLARRAYLEDDHRPLPEHLSELLAVRVVSDMLPAAEDAWTERWREARGMAEEAPLMAIAQFEGILDEIELPAPETHPMHFPNMDARLAVGLIKTEPGMCYGRYPSSYVPTLSQLAECYVAVGRHEEALAAMRQCIRCAPSCAYYYASLGDIHFWLEEYEAAFDAYNQGLYFACNVQDVGYLYYSMGSLMERTGRLDVAIGCYVRIPDDGNMWWMEYVSECLPRLCAETGVEEPSWEDANDILLAAHIISAPYRAITDDVRAVAQSVASDASCDASDIFDECAVRFCEAGMALLAGLALRARSNYLLNSQGTYGGACISYVEESLRWIPAVIVQADEDE